MANIKDSGNNRCWRGRTKRGSLLHCWWECKLVQPLWKTVLEVSQKTKNRGAWVAQLVGRPTSARVMVSRSMGSSPTSGSVLISRSPEPASDSVSPSLSAPPLLMLCLCVLKINKTLKKKNLKIELPYDPAIALLGIYHARDTGVLFRRDTCTPMCIAALSTIAKVWKEPKCPLMDEWIKKVW